MELKKQLSSVFPIFILNYKAIDGISKIATRPITELSWLRDRPRLMEEGREREREGGARDGEGVDEDVNYCQGAEIPKNKSNDLSDTPARCLTETKIDCERYRSFVDTKKTTKHTHTQTVAKITIFFPSVGRKSERENKRATHTHRLRSTFTVAAVFGHTPK